MAGLVTDLRQLLGDRSVRRLLGGRLVSLAGDDLYTVATLWLVYTLTGSTLLTGVAGFLSRAPGALGVLLGPLVDRSPLGRLLVGSELAGMALVAVVPLAEAAGLLSVELVLAVVPLVALAGELSGPAETAAVPRIVEESLLVRLNSVYRVSSGAVDTAANGLAGLAVAAIGAVPLFAVNAATFGLAAFLFAGMRVPAGGNGDDEGAASEPDEDDEEEGTGKATDGRLAEYLDELREGLGLLTGSLLGHMLAAATAANALAGVRTAVLPAYADGIGGAATYGLLLAGLTAGGLVGSFAGGALEGVSFGRLSVVGFTAAGLLLAGGVLVGGPLATTALFAAATVGTGAYSVLASAAVQTGVPNEMLGRTSAVIGSATGVAVPVGTLAGGVAGDLLGARPVLLLSAAGYLLAAGYWLVVPALRRFPPLASLEPGAFDPAG